jgi:hypothetical protein
MASPEAVKVFTELWSKINLEIEQNHKDYWPRIKSYLSNAVRRSTHNPESFSATVVPMLASYLVKQIPVIGSYISSLGEQAVVAVRSFWAEERMKMPVTDHEYAVASGDWWTTKGLQAYIDAARKYHDAVAAANDVEVTNCTTYKEKLAKLIYARYRLRRLESYYHMMETFQRLVKRELDKEKADWRSWQAVVEKQGPSFLDKDKEQWHLDHCRDSCMYPWPGGISKPFNPQRQPNPFMQQPPKS